MRAFTLVEILVALAILAVALAAGMRAVAQSADGATLLKQRTLALWVAQNRLAVAQLAPPPIGTSDGQATQGGQTFAWHAAVSTTANPAFRRIEVNVSAPDQPGYVLARLVGYVSPVRTRGARVATPCTRANLGSTGAPTHTAGHRKDSP